MSRSIHYGNQTFELKTLHVQFDDKSSANSTSIDSGFPFRFSYDFPSERNNIKPPSRVDFRRWFPIISHLSSIKLLEYPIYPIFWCIPYISYPIYHSPFFWCSPFTPSYPIQSSKDWASRALLGFPILRFHLEDLGSAGDKQRNAENGLGVGWFFDGVIYIRFLIFCKVLSVLWWFWRFHDGFEGFVMVLWWFMMVLKIWWWFYQVLW